jgi:hypothetical protein
MLYALCLPCAISLAVSSNFNDGQKAACNVTQQLEVNPKWNPEEAKQNAEKRM